MSKTGTITVALADDHHIVRQGLRLVLERSIDFELAGEAGDGLEAMDLVEQKAPDVLVIDLMIPRLHGLEVIKQVSKKHPETKTLVLSILRRAVRHGSSPQWRLRLSAQGLRWR